MQRWSAYIQDALIEPVISRDLLLLKRIDKPALLRQLFELGCSYSGQIVSFNKMLGQLQDAGNTTTIAHYLELLEKVNLLMGLKKNSGKAVRRRSSSPKFQVMNTALMTASQQIVDNSINLNPSTRGRLTESAIGAHLVNASIDGQLNVYYWRENNHEVDFVVQAGRHRSEKWKKTRVVSWSCCIRCKVQTDARYACGRRGRKHRKLSLDTSRAIAALTIACARLEMRSMPVKS